MSRAVAPTAPVEASGSEREHGPKCWGKTSASDEMAHCYCGSTDLRPQPSGGTREAVRLALEDADALDRVSEEADDNQWQDWAATMRQAASRIRRLALLSTSPLALGGQKGNSEILRVLLDNLVIAQTLSKDIRQKATDEARSYLYDLRHTPQPSGETREAVARALGERRGHPEPWPTDYYDTDAVLAALSTTPARAEAQDEGALSVLDRLLNYSGARGSFDAMKHGDAVKDAEELLRSVKSPSHTDLMVTPESIDAYMKVNPMEAQDEGAAGELKPCPFCGGEAEIIHLDDGDNAGGSCVCCTKCQASGNVEFGRKENFVDNWNRRAHPSPTPAADADRVRIAVEALEKAVWSLGSFGQLAADEEGGNTEGLDDEVVVRMTFPDPEYGGEKTLLGEVFVRAFRKAKTATDECREALAALKSTAAKEGGASQGDAAPEAS